MSTDPLAFDPGATLRVGSREDFVEATLRRLADGRQLIELHDEDGDVVASVSLRPDFMVRVEHVESEAAA